MKTITFKTAQAKFGKLVKLSDLQEKATEIIANLQNNFETLGSTNWLTNGSTGTDALLIQSLQKEDGSFQKITYTDSNGSEFEGYLVNWSISWNPSKQDWFIYGKIVSRPTSFNYQDTSSQLLLEELKSNFTDVTETTLHRSKINDFSTGEEIKRSLVDLSSIKTYLSNWKVANKK